MNDLLMTMQNIIQLENIYRYKRDKRERSLKVCCKFHEYFNIIYKKVDIVVELKQKNAHMKIKNAHIEKKNAFIEIKDARIDNHN